ncbi:hypothetical protein SCUCBS95973_005812 [Sporothrix curviconia]|uniref:F-box domain-containing protein n=1 Tax=Sporothrix curviconia TaxID=1260050 RepID=A0ABP0C1V7_9PEZI
MTRITDLPCEVISTVLRHVGKPKDLFSAVLTCRHFCASFQENPYVMVDIVRDQIAPALLPYAVAVLEASNLDLLTDETTQALLDQLREETELPSTPRSRLLTMPLSWLADMSRLHSVIHELVTIYANSAWEHLLSNLSSSAHLLAGDPEDADKGGPRAFNDCLSLSPAEYVRFCRAFYRAELYFCLFTAPADTRGDPKADPDGGIVAGVAFLQTLPLWENEQLGSVMEFLGLQFSKATRDVLAHDVQFGTWQVDYVYSGVLNHERQTWISQGLSFVYHLMMEPSWDVKNESLKRTYGAESSFLSRTLFYMYEEVDISVKDAKKQSDSNETYAVMFRPLDPRHDSDQGPFKAWWAAYQEMNIFALIATHKAGFREMAFVFWDEDRLQRYNVLELFTDTAPRSELEMEDVRSEILAMEASHRARKTVWQRGGRGYWSEDDDSRVVWTGEFRR